MALVHVNGFSVVSMELHRPRTGAWHAIVDVDAADAPTGQVTIDAADGKLQLRGNADRIGVFAGRVRIRVVGGAGGLAAPCGARFFRSLPARIPLVDLLTAGGETLSATSDADVLEQQLGAWTRIACTVEQALAALVRKLDRVWRMTTAGEVWIGRETWPESMLDFVLLEEDHSEKRIVIASEDPTLDAGVVLDGRRLSHVVQTFEASRVRTEAWLDVAG